MERAGTMGGAVGDGAPGCEAWAQVMPTQMWTATPDGRLNWANDRVMAYTGLPMDELTGQGWAQVIHPVDLPEVQQRWSQAITFGEPHEVEYRMRRADGEYRWHLSRAVPARDAQGGISQWMGSSTDIHELRLAEARSLRDRDRIWTLSQELMLVCDYTGHIRAVNPAATRILGWEEGEMVGRTVADFLHPDDLARTADEVGRLAASFNTMLAALATSAALLLRPSRTPTTTAAVLPPTPRPEPTDKGKGSPPPVAGSEKPAPPLVATPAPAGETEPREGRPGEVGTGEQHRIGPARLRRGAFEHLLDQRRPFAAADDLQKAEAVDRRTLERLRQ